MNFDHLIETTSEMLARTTEEKQPNITKNEIRFDGKTGFVLASARYKPEDESEHQTDHYGYAQTELQPVMNLRNLSEQEVSQVEEFVEDTMAQRTIHATRQKSITEKFQDQISLAID